MKLLGILSLMVGFASGATNTFSSHVANDRPLTYDMVKESCADQIFETKNLKPNWEFDEGFTWQDITYYAPVASAGDIYRVTQQLMGRNEFRDLRLSHLQNSCFRIRLNDATGMSREMVGYNDKHFTKKLSGVQGHPKTVSYPAPFPGNFGATLSMSLTDNKSYYVVVLCHKDQTGKEESGTWAVLSPFKQLPESDIKVALAHVAALGFDPAKAIRLDYVGNNCENSVQAVPS